MAGSVVHLSCGSTVVLGESVSEATQSLLDDPTTIVTQDDHRDKRVTIVAAHITHISEANV